MGFTNPLRGPIRTDPASTIAVVSTTVPFPFRDGAFWPCVNGEQFPPALSSGGTYSNASGYPVVSMGSLTGTPTATWPFLPRVSFAGKQGLSLTGKFISTGAGGNNGNGLTIFGFANGVPYGGANFRAIGNPTRRAAIVLQQTAGNVNKYDVTVTYSDGTTVTNTGALVAGVDAQSGGGTTPHDWSIQLTANGQLVVTWDGAVILTAASVWPATATDTPQASFGASGTGTNYVAGALAAMQTTWS